jgi:phage major head subunit gpT-like protein
MPYALSSRAASGRYFKRLADTKPAPIVQKLCTRIDSNQEIESLAWLSALPMWAEWNGDRKPVRQNPVTVSVLNRLYERSIEVAEMDFRRDKTGQIMLQMDQLADGTQELWYDLLVAVLKNAGALVCYDGQYFWDTDHAEGVSGTQLNLLAAAQVSALNVGTATAPTVDEASKAVMGVIHYMLGFKDDQGRYVNRGAKKFTVVAAANDVGAAIQEAVRVKLLNIGTGTRDNPLPEIFDVDCEIVPELSAYTDDFIVNRTDALVKPFVQQVEMEPSLDVLGEGSEHAKQTGKFMFGAKASGAVACGLWQYSAFATLS